MLQLADELREERVRMKLAEARIQFQERVRMSIMNTAIPSMITGRCNWHVNG
jgi:hypothetical protein